MHAQPTSALPTAFSSHPFCPADKFNAKFGRRLAPGDADRVLARVLALSQLLNAISATIQA